MNNIPTSPNDPVNTDILLVAEDRIKGFRRLPFHAISEQCGHPVPVVIQRLKAMMEAGVVRRVRQTLLATKLAQGALVAWSLPEGKLDAAFDWMKELDPFYGPCGAPQYGCGQPRRQLQALDHGQGARGVRYAGGTLRHPETPYRRRRLCSAAGTRRLCAGGGAHAPQGTQARRKTPEPAPMQETKTVSLSELEWKVLLSVKEQLRPEEMVEDPWSSVPPGQDWKRKNTAVRRKNWTGSRSSAVSPLFWNM